MYVRPRFAGNRRCMVMLQRALPIALVVAFVVGVSSASASTTYEGGMLSVERTPDGNHAQYTFTAAIWTSCSTTEEGCNYEPEISTFPEGQACAPTDSVWHGGYIVGGDRRESTAAWTEEGSARAQRRHACLYSNYGKVLLSDVPYTVPRAPRRRSTIRVHAQTRWRICTIWTGVEVAPDLYPELEHPWQKVSITVRGLTGRANGYVRRRKAPIGQSRLYRFSGLRPGRYRVSMRYPGDLWRTPTKTVQKNITVCGGRTA